VSDQQAGGLDLSVFASLGAQLGRVAAMMENRESRRAKLFEQLHQVPIAPPQIPLSGGTGALQMADLLSPKAGYMWSVRRLTASGFTAGTVMVYKNGYVDGAPGTQTAVGGEPVLPFAQAGVATIGRGELLLDQNDQLIIIATGITGSVQINGAADNFERWLLPEYLG
jgi:hypothetical protein